VDKAQYARFKALLLQHAAPFRETLVKREAVVQLDAAAVPHFEDPHGNIVVGVANERAYRKLVKVRSREPLRLFIAHMDHPGFHITRRLADDRLALRWYGGSPVKRLSGARLWLADGSGVELSGRLQKPQLHKSGRFLERAEVKLDQPLPKGCKLRSLYGGLSFRQPVWRRGQRIYTRAADDLVGVHAIIETARRLQRSRRRDAIPFIALLTRAEEVGFVGAVAHFELEWLQQARRPLLAVSLEASRTLPGAEIGKGPVVRIGDRRTVFSADGLKVLADLAERLLPKRHQRKLMDGGACEASAATAWGLPTIGLSVPLGNYHNQGFEGGDDCPHPEGPAPEFVDLRDAEGMAELCYGLMTKGLAWGDAWAAQRTDLRANVKRYAAKLKG